MSNCPKCGAEVETGQKMCAWCGTDLPKAAPTPAPGRVSPSAQPQHGEETSISEAQSTVTIDTARTLAKAGDLAGAEKAFKTLLADNPQEQEALFGLGGIHFKRGNKSLAAELWLRLKKLNPAYPHIDSWLDQVVEKTVPPPVSTPSIEAREEAPPSRPAQQPLQHSFQPKQRTRRPDSSPSQIDAPEGDDDWRNQSVRVMALDEPEAEEPAPTVSEVKAKPTSSIPQAERIAVWTRVVSWLCIVLFGAGVALVYFVLPQLAP